MIKEITNFIEYLENNDKEIFSENLKLKDGLYVFLEKNNKGELEIKDDNILKIDKKNRPEDLEGNEAKMYEEFLKLYSVTEMINNKSFNTTEKIFIDVGSPFAISISGKGHKKGRVKKEQALEKYFKATLNFIDKENEKQVKWFEEFQSFVNRRMFDYLDEHEDFQNPNDKLMFYFFLKEPSFDDYKDFYESYLQKKVFLYDLNEKKKETHGISNDLYTFNIKKQFLKHQTATFDINYKVDGTEAMKLYKFFRLQQANKILPNPFPLFIDKNELTHIDKNELTQEVVKFYNADKDKKMGHKEIVEHLVNDKTQDLSNYYLLYFNNSEEKSRIVDIDFVPVFKHQLDSPIQIDTFFNTKDKTIHFPVIETVFDFEKIIVQKIFNNSLVQYLSKTQNYNFRYFDEIDNNPKYITANTFIKVMKYRKAFYDYIYKSKRQAITDTMFQDIMKNSVLDDIRHDKDYNKTTTIKEKLNIWFSLYNYFKTNNKNQENMANKTKELYEKLKQMAKEEIKNEFIENDDLFAFASGQLIRTILNKSQTGERKHSLLEPFLQKTNPKQFKLAIARAFDTYKHEFQFYKGNKRYDFDKVMSDVMGYNPENPKMKEHLPFILAGYFAETVFKKETENE